MDREEMVQLGSEKHDSTLSTTGFVDDLTATMALKRFLIGRGISVPSGTLSALAKLEAKYAAQINYYTSDFAEK